MRFIVFLVVILICDWSCQREFDNPYDPESNGNALPVLSTSAVSNISTSFATCGGSISFNGGSLIAARGVCWSTSQTPTLSDSLSSDGNGDGSFTSTITGLTPATTYYVRAYATNSTGTAYGNEVSFTTSSAPTGPLVSTGSITNISQTSASGGGVVLSDGGASVTARGVCWSISANPTVAGNKTIDSTGTGNFISALTGLSANTTYYVRAYATNSIGTTYGNDVIFTTSSAPSAPTVSTGSITNISQTSASGGGNVLSDGGAAVTARGVCWSTSANPTVTGNKTIDGNGNGNFTSSLTGLSANTIYYVRAYATNSIGTTYGNDVSFTTSSAPTAPSVSTGSITNVSQTSASGGGNVLSDGGAAVTARGVCWSTSANPTISGNKTIDGSGIGAFTSSLTGLTANTTYYVRAYATNNIGTSYGNQQSFTSTGSGGGVVSNPGSGVLFNGYNYSSVVLGNGQEWMAENLRTTIYANGNSIPNVTAASQWASLSSGAWAHYDNDNQYNFPYGRLYNWYAVNDARNVCPTGWHVPSDADWNILIKYLDTTADTTCSGCFQSNVAGGYLKQTGTLYWSSPNFGASNISGFSSLPGGYRDVYGAFSEIGLYGYWWSSTQSSTVAAFTRELFHNNPYIGRSLRDKHDGYSVRCVRD